LVTSFLFEGFGKTERKKGRNGTGRGRFQR